MIAAAQWGAFAALSLMLGAWIAFIARPGRHRLGLLMGFGAGALISGIAYQLVAEASLHMEFHELAVGLGMGATVFYGLDSLIERRRAAPPAGKGASSQPGEGGFAILLGTLLDGIPESLVLGMSLAATGAVSAAYLAAVFLSNLPEAISGTMDMESGGWSRRRITVVWAIAVGVSAAMAGVGFELRGWSAGLAGGFFEALAAGALLMMLADAMIPEALEFGGKRAGFFLVLGFAVVTGLAG